jgi:methionyl-tRNA formyltransferase
MRGIFFGSSALVGEIVNKTIGIGIVVVEKQLFSKELMNFAHYIDAQLIPIESIDQVLKIDNKGEIGVSYGFGMKFTKDVIDSFPCGVMNIHTGDLPAYRSRHPISWAMINGEQNIGITFHKIDEKIDCGHLVHKFYVERRFSDDLNSLQIKIEDALENEFPRAVARLASSNFEKLSEGAYLKRIDKVFSNVDPGDMSSKQLFSLFSSQKIYGGVNILGKKHSECNIYNNEFQAHYDGCEIYRCKDGVFVALK